MSMFASRASRSSVMIGPALKKREMEEIVRKLNGRPTMRHLVDLQALDKTVVTKRSRSTALM